MSKQVCDVMVTSKMTTSQSNEHLRKATDAASQKKWSGNYDPTREHLNFEVTKGGVVVPVNKKKSISRRIKENLKVREIEMPKPIQMKDGTMKERRTIVNIILGGSREQMHRLAFGGQQVNLNPGSDNGNVVRQKDIEDWAVDTYNFLAKKYGEKNIAAFVVHLDETNPHVHATILPITKEGKFSYNKLFGGTDAHKKYTALHDEFAEVNMKYGLERGESVAVTGAKHRSTEEYHAWMDSEYRKMLQDLGDMNRQGITLDDDLKKATRRVKGLATMLANLEKQKEQIETEIASLEEESKNGLTNEELLIRKKELEKSLDSVLGRMRERRDQLQKAKLQLQEVVDRKAEFVDASSDLERKIEQLKSASETVNVQRELVNWAYNEIAKKSIQEYADIVDMLNNAEKISPREEKVLNDALDDCTVLEDIAARADKVAAVASALFLGYIDAATDFAQKNGGGGGGPSSGWGKDKDDDDEMWRRKCLFMGMQMMRPAGKNNKVDNKVRNPFKRK